MIARILVAHGEGEALAEAARVVAGVLQEAGAELMVRPAREVESVEAYDSVIACGALTLKGLDPRMLGFVTRDRRPLSHRSIAYLVDCAPGIDREDTALLRRLMFPLIDWLAELRPVSVGYFRLDRSRGEKWRVREWARGLRWNFIGPSAEPPSGVRTFLDPANPSSHASDFDPLHPW